MRHATISFALICAATGCATPGASTRAPTAGWPAAHATSTAAPAPVERTAVSGEERHWQELPRFRSVQIALLYSHLGKTDPSYDDLAWFYESVSKAPDEFTRSDAIARARSQLAKEDGKLRHVRNFVITSSEVLNAPYAYDSQRKGWASPVKRVAGFTYDLPRAHVAFAVRFSNADRLAFIPMGEEAAREISELPSREVDLDIECHPLGTRSNKTGKADERAVLARIVRVRVRPHDAEKPIYADIVLDEREPPTSPSPATRAPQKP